MRFVPGLIILVTAAASAVSVARAVDPPRQVADLRTVPAQTDGSWPHGFVSLGGDAIFVARPDDFGDGLFRSDGTAAGTIELARPCARHETGWGSYWNLAGSHAYFLFVCESSGYSLWATDGTPGGTSEILPADALRLPQSWSSAPVGVAEGERLIFLQGGGYESPLELWSSDGSAAGTIRIATISLDAEASAAIARRGASDYLLLVQVEGSGFAVWRSDGTEPGTVEAFPLALDPSASYVTAFMATPSGFAFGFERYLDSDELWHTDGTESGTAPLTSFGEVGWESLAVHDGALYFSAGVPGATAILRSEGSVATTRALAFLDSTLEVPTRFEYAEDWLYFQRSSSAWSESSIVRVPVEGGAVDPVIESCDDDYCSSFNYALWFRLVGDRIVLTRKEREQYSVWSCASDGSNATYVADLCEDDACFLPETLPATVDGGVLFTTAAAGGARELWFSDGTSSGGRRVAGPLAAIPLESRPWPYSTTVSEVDGGWLFSAADDLHGRELWRANAGGGTPAELLDLRIDRPGVLGFESVGFAGSDYIFSIQTDYDWRTLYRHAVGGVGAEPFLQVPIRHGRHGSRNGPPTVHLAGNAWFFIERPAPESSEHSPRQAWRFDPVSGDLRTLFAHPEADGVGATVNELYERGGDAFLVGSRDDQFRPAVFKVRPLSGQTVKWLDLPAGYVESIGRSRDSWFLLEDSTRLTVFDLARRERHELVELSYGSMRGAVVLQDGALIVVEDDDPSTGARRTMLWQSDGTATGTRALESWIEDEGCLAWITLPPASADAPRLFTVDRNCNRGVELWTSDGSEHRTRQLATLEDGSFQVPTGGLRLLGDTYFFIYRPSSSSGSPSAYELWSSDGTPAGTRAVTSLPPDEGWYPHWIDAAAGAEAIYFIWPTAGEGFELWRSDGTAAGTGPAGDLNPGTASSWPSSLRTVGDQVLFLAARQDVGVELWESDGSLDSPRLVADLYPGDESARASIVASSDEALMLLADDGVTGLELWEVGSPSVAPCDPAADLCFASNRFRSRAVFRDFEGRSGAAQPAALTGESGYFWFFDAANPELLAKVVDACALPAFENFWAFTSGLTNLEVTLETVDTWSGERSKVVNRMGQRFAPSFDSGSFHVCGGSAGSSPAPPATTVDTDRLSLLGGRFEVVADWATAGGESGSGHAVALGDGGGYFWFFTPSNVELFVKMADACGLAGFENHWLFAAGLTDIEVELTARDLVSGETIVYRARPGQPFTPILDTGRFRSCP